MMLSSLEGLNERVKLRIAFYNLLKRRSGECEFKEEEEGQIFKHFIKMYNQVTRYLPESYGRIKSKDQEIANKVIENPYAFLLTQKEVNEAMGGKIGFSMELLGISFGIWLPIHVNARINSCITRGSFTMRALGTLGIFMFLSQRFFRNRAINWFGDRNALTAHNLAYYYVKGNNRYEGRKVLTKKPFMY